MITIMHIKINNGNGSIRPTLGSYELINKHSVIPVVSRFGSEVDIGSAIGIGQCRQKQYRLIGISANSHIGASLVITSSS